ncbi:hypothetical protein FE257_008424 [Aspergillus nanangensis]|uniref:LaeA-like methyltransferase n=1 Tax=Aspergillus nanangensis TaxID=2582783 RepID=A0AAD4CLH2_ASPNN|nr:hypothetical protein FE257_008424 [Aspergillus nanangensis]
MGSIGEEEVYLFGRNAEESERLNVQHEFMVSLIGSSPLHPSIPTENIVSVADVATGTGIWLSTLPKHLPSNSHRLYLHGFDISSAQFPFLKDITPTYETHLSAHDMRERFPAEHHGRYDLVHLRLLTGALKNDEYPRSMKHVYELLNPGGYLQWDECDCSAFDIAEKTPSLIAVQMKQHVLDAVSTLGLCPSPAAEIERLAKKVGMVDVTRDRYTTLDKPHVHEAARAWIVTVMKALLPAAIMGSGKTADRDEAMESANRIMEEFEEHTVSALPLVNLQVIVGRKPL